MKSEPASNGRGGMSSGTKFAPGPWEVDTIKSYGEYGDGGPDSRSGYDAYAVFDAQGRSLFDSLNRDGRVSEIHEDGPDEDGRGAAWDELARRDLTLADAEHGMKNAGNGLGCRVVPLYDAEIFATWLDAEHKRRKHRDNFAAVLAKRFRTEVLQPNAGVER